MTKTKDATPEPDWNAIERDIGHAKHIMSGQSVGIRLLNYLELYKRRAEEAEAALMKMKKMNSNWRKDQ